MAVSALKTVFCLVLMTLLVLPAQACFGPKLYLGLPATTRGAVLAELAALYVKEKTGVESILVPLEDHDPVAEVLAGRLDLVVVAVADQRLPDLFAVVDVPALLSGPRPIEELQFTTVGPALHKLAGLLDATTFAALVDDVEAGEPPKARVRRLLMERGWI